MKSIRDVYFFGLLICIGLFVAAAYLQFEQGLAPCSLCDLQRIAFAMILLCYLFALIHNPGRKGATGYALLILLFAGAGGFFAGRQIWLQQQPLGSITSCSVGLEFLLNSLPFWEAMRSAVQGSIQCATVLWSFCGLTIPHYALILFIVLGLIGLVQIKRAR